MIFRKHKIKRILEKNGIILSEKINLGGVCMKEKVLSLLESESMVEEQGLKSSFSSPINIGRLDGVVYDPNNHKDNPIGVLKVSSIDKK